MNRTNDLDRLDRATLRTWRVSNLLSWGAVAAWAGYVGNWIALNAASATAGVVGGGLGGEIAIDLLYVGAVGAIIGWMVGAHVYRSPRLVAGLAAVVATYLFPEAGVLIDPSVGVVPGAVVEIGAAVAVGGAVWRHRPAALRSS